MRGGIYEEACVETRSSRDIIHTCLETNQVELLLQAAIASGGNAHHDADVFRALMQLALRDGDLETVRQASLRMLDIGIALGLLPMALEAICLFRNVGGDASEPTERLLHALETRGFDDERVPYYPEWTPSLGSDEGTPTVTPVDLLAMLQENPVPAVQGRFAWVSLWAQLSTEARRQLIQGIHFELRRIDETLLAPPRLSACWVASGSVQSASGLHLCAPGTMVLPGTEARELRAGSHLRMIGLREDRWSAMKALPEFAQQWEAIALRHRVLRTLIQHADRASITEQAARTLLENARQRPSDDPTIVAIDDTLVLLINRDDRATPNAHLDVAPGSDAQANAQDPVAGAEEFSFVLVPKGTNVTLAAQLALEWPVAYFQSILPLDALRYRRLADV